VSVRDFQEMPAKVVEVGFRRWYIARTLILPPDNRTTTMAQPHRRQFLKDLLGTLAQGAGTVVLAAAATAHARAQVASGQNTDIQKRAEGLAGAAGASEEDLLVNFVNRAFRNGGGGGFRNGGFANGGVGGGFRNGGFANGYGGGFRNGAFRNW
jgi:rSAM-associated Gly-rich repeat protein